MVKTSTNKKQKKKNKEKTQKKEIGESNYNSNICSDFCKNIITHSHPMIGTCCSECFYEYNNNL